MTSWINGKGPMGEIVISSRLRLARNLAKYPFPIALNQDSGNKLITNIKESVFEEVEKLKTNYTFIDMAETSDLEKQIMLEKHLASAEFIKPGIPRAMFVNKEETMSIMINEEDHLRIQCLLSGLRLNEGWVMANEMDDFLDEKIAYAFDEKIGYLTSCTTNVGTGLRASVMLHLPGLTMTGDIEGIYKAANQMGLAIRGMYGEGSEALGDMYQISNQITLGRTEEEIINTLNEVTIQIVGREEMTRRQLVQHNPYEIEDKIHRAYGVLTNARVLSSREALEKMSFVRMGIALGLITDVNWNQMNKLLLDIQPGFLQRFFNKELDPFTRDVKRAEFIRNKLMHKGCE